MKLLVSSLLLLALPVFLWLLCFHRDQSCPWCGSWMMEMDENPPKWKCHSCGTDFFITYSDAEKMNHE